MDFSSLKKGGEKENKRRKRTFLWRRPQKDTLVIGTALVRHPIAHQCRAYCRVLWVVCLLGASSLLQEEFSLYHNFNMPSASFVSL